jgi:hypothetical protein
LFPDLLGMNLSPPVLSLDGELRRVVGERKEDVD